MLSIELCFSLHMDRLWRKAPSFAVNRATRVLKLPLSGHKEPQAAAAGGLPSETDGLGRKESGFGNGQQDRGVGARVRARGVHGAQTAARALLPRVPGEGGSPRRVKAQVPPSRSAVAMAASGLPRPGVAVVLEGAGRGEAASFLDGRPRVRPAGRTRSRYRLSSRSTRADSGTGRNGLCLSSASAYIRMYAYAHIRNRTFSFLRICAVHLHLGGYRHGMRARGRWMTMEDGLRKEDSHQRSGGFWRDDGRR